MDPNKLVKPSPLSNVNKLLAVVVGILYLGIIVGFIVLRMNSQGSSVPTETSMNTAPSVVPTPTTVVTEKDIQAIDPSASSAAEIQNLSTDLKAL